MTARFYPYPAPTFPKVGAKEGEIRQARAVSPESFRATATGCGSTIATSHMAGTMRNVRIWDSVPDKAAVPIAEGYPRGDTPL